MVKIKIWNVLFIIFMNYFLLRVALFFCFILLSQKDHQRKTSLSGMIAGKLTSLEPHPEEGTLCPDQDLVTGVVTPHTLPPTPWYLLVATEAQVPIKTSNSPSSIRLLLIQIFEILCFLCVFKVSGKTRGQNVMHKSILF